MTRKCHEGDYYAIVMRHSEPDSEGRAEVYELAVVKIQKGVEADYVHLVIERDGDVSNRHNETEDTDDTVVTVSEKEAIEILQEFMPDAMDRRTPLLCKSRAERSVFWFFLRSNGNGDDPEYINLLEKNVDWFGKEKPEGDDCSQCEKSIHDELTHLSLNFRHLEQKRIKESVDVYDCMRSTEIREFYRDKWILDTNEKMTLVWHSMLPFREKLEIFKSLKAEAVGEAAKMLKETIDVISDFLNSLDHPGERVLYVMERHFPPEGMMKDDEMILMILDEFNHLECTDTVCTELLFRDTIDEVISTVNEQIEYAQERGYNDVHELYYVYQWIIPEQGSSYSDFEFYVMDIDGKAAITHLYTSLGYRVDEQGEHIFDPFFGGALDYDIDLPYESGEILKLQTPLMDKPAYGYFYKDWALGWYNHLYCEKDDRDSKDENRNMRFLSLCSIYPDLSPYTLFDCIERAKKSFPI